MSSCLTGGGGRTYALDLEIVKSPSTTSTWTSQTHTHTHTSSSSSSSSSTLSESSNSPLAISTRKPRTPRKRPNQTYNEAAALLSTAYPNIFSTKNLTKPRKFTKQHDYYDESSELLLPFRVIDSSGFLLHQPSLEEKPISQFQSSKVSKPGEADFHGHGNSTELCCDGYGYEEDFDAESILDEEIEEGIDSIMGNLSVNSSAQVADEWKGPRRALAMNNCWNSNVNLGFGGKFESGLVGNNMRALRHVEEEEINWWSCPNPIVDVRQISPKFHNALSPSSVLTEEKKKQKKKKKKKKKLENLEEPVAVDTEISASVPKPDSGLLLKLNFDEVLNAWSDRGCPFSDQIPPGSEFPGNDVYARAAQIDLFSESGGLREASVLRYKEKRRTRLFSKKIRYQVRKVNADRRPRMKGRFVRRPNSSANGQR